MSNSSYDEMFSGPGVLREHWQRFVQALTPLSRQEFSRRWEQSQRLLHENGIAFSAYADPEDTPRPWELDALPLLIGAKEWEALAAGLEQRAQLLNLVLGDLYGSQTLLKSGLVPPELVFSHPGFLRPLHGQRPSGDRFLHFYAADLARSSDGRWWVLADRTEAPSGLGYALENRFVISRMLPTIFHQCRAERLSPYFIALRETLHNLASHHRENPRVVLLSQGPRNENYFEDAYLARYLGYSLVEGGDLTVRNDQVMLKTLGGLLPVDVIMRRPNSEECDPIELSGNSPFGVAGLVQAMRSKHVGVASTLGSGLVESPVFLALMPSLCRELLGEDLRLPTVGSWWCGEADGLQFVLDNLDQLIFKRAFRRRGYQDTVSQQLNDLTTAELGAMIRSNPAAFVAQDVVARSVTPVWRNGKLQSSHIALRAYLVAAGDSYIVMRGGLARVSSSSEPLDVSILTGEGSKDTWVLSAGPVSPGRSLPISDHTIQLRRGGTELPSRVADNVFWLGRHLERTEAAARLIRTTATRLSSETEATNMPELPILLRALAKKGLIEPGYVVEGICDQLPAIEDSLPASALEEGQPGSLRGMIHTMFRMALFVRERMSLDSWRTIYRIEEEFTLPSTVRVDLTDLLTMTNNVVIDLAAFSGLVMESMTRSQAWRFLDLGRRLERALQTISLVRDCLVEPAEQLRPVMESVLEIADSLMTYRSRYLANLQLVSLLDLLLIDETNPRSVAYQLVSLADHVEQLPREGAQPLHAPEQRVAMSLLHNIRMADVQVLTELHTLGEKKELEQLLNILESELPELSEVISHRYLVHSGPTHQLSAIRAE